VAALEFDDAIEVLAHSAEELGAGIAAYFDKH
jgi:hypothetical protein